MGFLKNRGVLLLSGGFNAYGTETPGESGSSGAVSAVEDFGIQVSNVMDAITGNPDLIYLLLVAIATIIAVPLIICGLRRRKRRRSGPPPMTQQKYGLYEWSCVLIMILLISSDAFAMSNMFSFFGLTPWEYRIYSATFALFLEGFPWVLGRITPLIKDPVQYIRGRRRAYRGIAFFCWFALYAAWTLTIVIRVLHTYVLDPTIDPTSLTLGDIISSGFTAFLSGNYTTGFGYGGSDNDTYLAQVFLYVSPVLTSVLAYALTLVAFSSNNAAMAAKDMQKALEYYQWCQERYKDAAGRCEDAKRSIWASLNGGDDDFYDDLDYFRKSCHVLVHDSLIEECLEAYPSVLKQYNEAVEDALAEFISKCADYSTEPHKVGRITVKEIIEDYEKDIEKPVNKWNYEACCQEMTHNLEELLDHTIIMAQFQKASKRNS